MQKIGKVNIYMSALLLFGIVAVISLLSRPSRNPAPMSVVAVASPLPTPTSIFIPKIYVPITGGGSPSVHDELAEIDHALGESISSSISYTKLTDMDLGETATVELLMNPNISEVELVKQAEAIGVFANGVAEITPRMKAEIITPDNETFSIQPIHDNEIQPVITGDTARWDWYVTARESGTKKMSLVLYRYVIFDDVEYWREAYRHEFDIEITTTLSQRILALDWKWILGILLTALLIPGFWRWYDKGIKNRNNANKSKRRGKKNLG